MVVMVVMVVVMVVMVVLMVVMVVVNVVINTTKKFYLFAIFKKGSCFLGLLNNHGR